ncbi:cytochrome family protein [Bradyrhizobium sp. CB1650]|uniref:cytochrome family protein n=1 Tax=Bradyrhizobium sp. CB1650 TaxID=3039153 RepID=UPI002434A21F|nr:cytochrome family protein [Bradyrhizobium sp. CB1650]WGD50238.1 cytochrome family protein [Bradyrhizobium sp. CB1650]
MDLGPFSTISKSPLALGLLSAAIMIPLTAAFVNSPGAHAGTAAASSTQPATYLPSISDMMIGTIQPRHERIWRAEQAGDWDFAAYELGNLRGAFGRLGRAHPMEENIPFPDMIESVTKQPLEDLKGAIDRKDDAEFGKAYDSLSEACNSCHQALNHGTILIGRPTSASQSDLVFGKAGR